MPQMERQQQCSKLLPCTGIKPDPTTENALHLTESFSQSDSCLVLPAYACAVKKDDDIRVWLYNILA